MERETADMDMRKDGEMESVPTPRSCPVCRKPLVECDGCYDDADVGE